MLNLTLLKRGMQKALLGSVLLGSLLALLAQVQAQAQAQAQPASATARSAAPPASYQQFGPYKWLSRQDYYYPSVAHKMAVLLGDLGYGADPGICISACIYRYGRHMRLC